MCTNGKNNRVGYKNRQRNKIQKCSQQFPCNHTRPLNRFLLKCSDILALSKRITQIISCWCVRLSVSSPAALQGQQAAVSRLMNILLSSRHARDKKKRLAFWQQILCLVLQERRRTGEETKRCDWLLPSGRRLVLQVSVICRFYQQKTTSRCWETTWVLQRLFLTRHNLCALFLTHFFFPGRIKTCFQPREFDSQVDCEQPDCQTHIKDESCDLISKLWPCDEHMK